ncbi:MAG: EamA family transporter RarD [Hyphomonadaceae bacterium]|nr:EamA family transporter RarD [Hyphomonadaceae bacterium]
MTTSPSAMTDQTRTGLIAAFGAYAMWGVLPGYLKLMDAVDVREILAQRIVWTIPAVLAAIAVFGGGLAKSLRDVRAGFAPGAFWPLCGSAALIAFNWAVFLWAVQNDRVIESSLGYFLNPLVNVALGVLLLGEKLRRMQSIAIACAAIGVAVQAFALGHAPWVSLALCFSFAFYGLIRKRTAVTAAAGLLVETLILAPFAVGALLWLAARAPLHFGADPWQTVWLSLSGVVTAAPLILFALAARRLRLSTMGVIQFLAPSMQFAIGAASGEPLTPLRLASFAIIWLGLALFAADAVRREAA